MKDLRKIIVTLALVCFTWSLAAGQSITGTTYIDFDPNAGNVTATCETDLDSEVQGFYKAVVHCTVTDGAGAVVASGSKTDTNLGFAQAVVTFAGVAGTTYTATGQNLAVITQGDYAIPPPHQPSPWFWDDYYNFYAFQNEGVNYPDEHTWIGPGPPQLRKLNSLHVGNTTDFVSISIAVTTYKMVTVNANGTVTFAQACPGTSKATCGAPNLLGQQPTNWAEEFQLYVKVGGMQPYCTPASVIQYINGTPYPCT
jgi:hypothetical protein